MDEAKKSYKEIQEAGGFTMSEILAMVRTMPDDMMINVNLSREDDANG